MTSATRVGVALAGLLLAVLVASGAWLWWNYVPNRDQWVRTVHQFSAIALLVVAVALVVIAIVRRARIGAAGIVAAVGVFVTTGAAYVLGRLLLWDFAGLSSLEVGTDVRGMQSIFAEDVKFVIIDAREVSATTFKGWAIAHLALSALVVLALVMVWLRTRDGDVSRRPRPTPAPAPAPEPAPGPGPAG